MPAAAGCEILIARNGDPGREATLGRVIARSRNAESACCRDLQLPMKHAARAAILIGRHLSTAAGRICIRTVLAPVKRRVGTENLQPAHQKQAETENVDPVCHAGRQRVPADDCCHRACWSGLAVIVECCHDRFRCPVPSRPYSMYVGEAGFVTGVPKFSLQPGTCRRERLAARLSGHPADAVTSA